MSDSKTNSKKMGGMTVQIILSAISILLGVLFLFVPQVQVTTLCYVFCAALIVAGIVAIVSFFMSEAYKKVDDYHFASGVVLLILGICGLLRVNDLARDFETYLGLVVLILGVVILQGTVQLRVLNNVMWIVELILTVVTLFGAIVILANIKAVMNAIDGFTYWVLIVAGAASVVSLIISSLGVHRNKKKESKAQAAAENGAGEAE